MVGLLWGRVGAWGHSVEDHGLKGALGGEGAHGGVGVLEVVDRGGHEWDDEVAPVPGAWTAVEGAWSWGMSLRKQIRDSTLTYTSIAITSDS